MIRVQDSSIISHRPACHPFAVEGNVGFIFVFVFYIIGSIGSIHVIHSGANFSSLTDKSLCSAFSLGRLQRNSCHLSAVVVGLLVTGKSGLDFLFFILGCSCPYTQNALGHPVDLGEFELILTVVKEKKNQQGKYVVANHVGSRGK